MKKQALSVLLALILICTMSPTAYAQETTPSSQGFWDFINSISTNPKSFCDDCSWLTVSVCTDDTKLEHAGYGKGFLSLSDSDCYSHYYVSRSQEYCPSCCKVLQIYDHEHNCFQVHEKCSIGTLDTCPMDISHRR